MKPRVCWYPCTVPFPEACSFQTSFSLQILSTVCAYASHQAMANTGYFSVFYSSHKQLWILAGDEEGSGKQG